MTTFTPPRAAAGSRHRRQLLLPWLDRPGQERIDRATVLIARVGGLGGPLVQSLVVAGVGRILFYHEGELLDEDLHRMVLMDPDGVGRPRAPQAEATIRTLAGAGCEAVGRDARITPADAARLMATADLAIGAAPTYEERLILNDAARAAGKPFVDAAMYDDEAHLLCVHPRRGACLRCLVPEPPAWRSDFPVLGAVSATIGNLAAYHVIRILAGVRDVPWGELLHLDLEQSTLTRTAVPRRPECPACASVPEDRCAADRRPADRRPGDLRPGDRGPANQGV
jgi:molybdopterin/thiamine biosynthesis adenylyltransferase